MANDRFDMRRPGVFRTKLMETVRVPGEGSPLMMGPQPNPDFVRVDQTPQEQRCTFNANFPRFDLLDVQNLPNRKRV